MENPGGSLIKQKFIAQLCRSYPSLSPEVLDPLVSENLVSEHKVVLPKKVLHDIENFIKVSYRLRDTHKYQKSLSDEASQRRIFDPGNKSICMSYDFHITDQNEIKLIEVNTNASFLALGWEVYQTFGFEPPAFFSIVDLKKCIEEEISLRGRNAKQPFSIQIVDEKPEEQRLYVEFLVYQALFQKWGWNAEIRDVSAVDRCDFVYNRCTDFFLETHSTRNLRALWEKGLCLSPNPYEYLLLADKHRLIDWSHDELLSSCLTKEDIKTLRKGLPQCFDLTPETAQQLWAQRKGLFFKPKRQFGAKQSYKGSSISARLFEEIQNQDFIAQEYIAAPEREFSNRQGSEKFKFDLRCYAYKDQLQLIIARLYQGQVTNLRTPGGGFACVLFVDE